MYLKSLDLQGFKSFADKIHMEIDKGITAIVGPNGSGKSNVSDAIRWVMGEQSAKSLRGSKMEDIIFAGTQTRKPLGFAEVTMTLDNSDHALDIAYDEVSITRRVYRSGESEYLINKAPCRLKDIHELFMDTGLGRDGYSVIGQGKIDDVLYAKPEERRQIFEEAAGISKYKYRKLESERRLRQTEENLVRIRDIILELERQVEPLRIQSEKAKEFLELQSELKTLEVNTSLTLIDRHRQTLEEIGGQYTALEEQTRQEKEALEQAEEQVQALYEANKETDEAITAARETIHNLEMDNARMESAVSVFESNIENHRQNMERIEAELSALSAQAGTMEAENAKAMEKIEALAGEKAALDERLAEIQKDDDKAGAEIDAVSRQIEAAKDRCDALRLEISDAEHKIESAAMLRTNFSQRMQALETGLTENAGEMRRIAAIVEKIEAQHGETAAAKTRAEQELAECQTEYRAKRQQKQEAEEAFNQRSMEENRLHSRQKLLEELERDLDGYSEGVKNVLRAQKQGAFSKVEIHGVVSRVIKTPPEYVTAIEIALAAAAQNIIVETENDAKAIIAHLKQTKGGRVTLLPVEAMRPRTLEAGISGEPGFIGAADTLIEVPAHLESVLSSLLGGVAVFDNIDHAVQAARRYQYKIKIVTLAGELLNPGGSISGGSVNRSRGLLSRRGEIAALKEKAAVITKEMNKLEDDIEEYETELNGLESKLSAGRAKVQELEKEALAHQSALDLNRRLLDTLQNQAQQLEGEKAALYQQMEQAKSQKAEQEAFIAARQTTLGEAQAEHERLQATLPGLIQQREALRRRGTETTIARGALEKDEELYRQRIAAYQANKESGAQLEQMKQNELSALAGRIQEIEGQIAAEREKGAANELQLQRVQQQIEEALTGKTEVDGQILALRERGKQQRETVFRLQEQLSKIENKKNKAELELEATINRLWEEYELTYTTALALRCDIGPQGAAQKRISAIKSSIRALGSINVGAIEEYKTVKERYEFMAAQQEDLEVSKQNLEKIIKDMMKIMEERFSEQFAVINAKFRETFVNLMGGGTAMLSLTDPERVLESGIEIDVQPPGKKLQNIMLLSGGEKAFVAIALVFALLEVRPSPFCILDEIEAALDEANVTKYAKYLKNYLSSTQFIVITHRRGTMENADMLYGVTMQEKGISKVLSIRLDETNLGK